MTAPKEKIITDTRKIYTNSDVELLDAIKDAINTQATFNFGPIPQESPAMAKIAEELGRKFFRDKPDDRVIDLADLKTIVFAGVKSIASQIPEDGSFMRSVMDEIYNKLGKEDFKEAPEKVTEPAKLGKKQ